MRGPMRGRGFLLSRRRGDCAPFVGPTRPPTPLSPPVPAPSPRLFAGRLRARREKRGDCAKLRGREGGTQKSSFSRRAMRAKPRHARAQSPRLSRIPSPGAGGGAGTGEAQASAAGVFFCKPD